MSFRKFANASIVTPVITSREWGLMHGRKTGGGFNKIASFENKLMGQYLLSHCTIMSSVACEDEPHDWFIKPECSHLVNNNEDAWENEVLRLSAPSFIGAFNFLEHNQDPSLSKGFIVDAILRKIFITANTFVYFCDILVATSLKEEELVNDIKSGKQKYMSMGCIADRITCSYCGKQVIDEHDVCFCLAYHKGHFLPDDEGVSRRVAELCGHKSMPNGGVHYVEASWVGTPAFPGAERRNIITTAWTPPVGLTAKKASNNPTGIAKAASARSAENRLFTTTNELGNYLADHHDSAVLNSLLLK